MTDILMAVIVLAALAFFAFLFWLDSKKVTR